jgi:hypothetical protein
MLGATVTNNYVVKFAEILQIFNFVFRSFRLVPSLPRKLHEGTDFPAAGDNSWLVISGNTRRLMY